jgi:SulP family sulfate permease
VAVRQQGIGGAAKVSIVASVLMLVFCVLRLGRYVHRVPLTVVSGFSCGIGAMMLISQLDVILGVSLPAMHNSTTTLAQLLALVDNLPHWRGGPLTLALLVILAALICGRWAPRLPAPLVGVLAAIVGERLLGLHEREVGALPVGLPAFVGFSWRPEDVSTVLPSALALAFVTAINVLITSRVVEHFRGRHKHMKPSDADAELGAYGIANICAGLFGAPMSVGIPARSLANARCGGVTRLSNVFHGGFLLLFLTLGAALVAHIPIPALAGITAWMGLCLLEWSTWRRLPRMRRVDAAAFLATAFSVLLVNAVAAVAIGCSLYVVRRAVMWASGSTPVRPLGEGVARLP